jgi:hypothetical protein
MGIPIKRFGTNNFARVLFRVDNRTVPHRQYNGDVFAPTCSDFQLLVAVLFECKFSVLVV